jgi:hypothetical protein
MFDTSFLGKQKSETKTLRRPGDFHLLFSQIHDFSPPVSRRVYLWEAKSNTDTILQNLNNFKSIFLNSPRF